MKNKRKEMKRNETAITGLKRKPGIRGLALLALVFFLVTATFVLWGLTAGLKSGSPESFLPLLVALVVLALGYWYFARERENVDSGLPFEDEFSKKAKQKAAYYAFLAGIWFNLILAWAIDEGIVTLIPRHALFASMLAMTLVFIVGWVYFTKKGISE